jgi:hypothetical protein
MKIIGNILPLLMMFLLIAGCASKPIPAWRYESFGHLENYKKNYLSGKDQIAEFHYRKALEEVKRSGDLKLIARIYLTKYAIKIALLEDISDSEYPDIEVIEPDAENRNFFVFLKGNLAVVDPKLLPGQYRAFLKAGMTGRDVSINDAIAGIGDPLSRLIATGIVVKKTVYNEMTLLNAIDTASANGWQKPLLAYLDKLQQFYDANNQKEKASAVRQKIKAIRD